MELKRLTWKEIREKYPHQWVGLTEIEWKGENSPNIESAVVKYTNKTKDELVNIKYDSERDLIYRYTTPEDSCDIGFLMG